MIHEGVIRLIEFADLPALEWEGEYTHFRRVYREVYEHYQMGRALPWVIELPRLGIIGQLFVQLDCRNKTLADGVERAYLFAFRIRPAYRNQGWGTKLLGFVERDLYTKGYRRTTLRVSKSNESARCFYERRGYSVVGEDCSEWRYVDHRGVERVVCDPCYQMEKHLRKPLAVARKL
ncbi:MAG: GNAT family N-acetyltransferase [Anaerolineales bacterium]|nr:GNAT family N-acetyltransferase [Anaerolineales bacterium]MDW8160608.1 GNAT family N-acetyltransferase [Anaerolineales bacterium]